MKSLYRYPLMTLLLFLVTAASGQERPVHPRVQVLQTYLQNFEYEKIVRAATPLLEQPEALSVSDRIELYRLKGMAHYSLIEMDQAMTSFIALLQLDPDYEMDPVKTSPKILNFFNQIKDHLSATQDDSTTSPPPTRIDTVRVTVTPPPDRPANAWSLLLPGAGQWRRGQKTRGALLTTGAILSLGATVYYTLETRSARIDYLNETDPDQIKCRYDRYNSAFQKRTASALIYTVVWAVAQVDLLVFEHESLSATTSLQAHPAGTPMVCTTIRF